MTKKFTLPSRKTFPQPLPKPKPFPWPWRKKGSDG